MVKPMVQPYNHTEARKQAKAEGKREGEKWKPELRYVKDKYGIPSLHSGPNRRDRRNYYRLVRRGLAEL
jgi:hypothetical protein